MGKTLSAKLEGLRRQLLVVGALAGESLEQARRAFLAGDVALAQEVRENDRLLNQAEIALEESCLAVLALFQPVAGDLRQVITILKINNDLERIGDLCVKIALKVAPMAAAARLGGQAGPAQTPPELVQMFVKVAALLSQSLDAFVHFDVDLAHRVRLWDDEVDRMKGAIRARIEEIMQRSPERYAQLNILLGVSRGLERIADHATNIAEDVIYMQQGAIVRHRPEPGDAAAGA
ncbi:MAG: phosphate signaling complex protein PhoU [Thermodesulfobacteriota bacterium]